jgi:hypothetical protein
LLNLEREQRERERYERKYRYRKIRRSTDTRKEDTRKQTEEKREKGKRLEIACIAQERMLDLSGREMKSRPRKQDMPHALNSARPWVLLVVERRSVWPWAATQMKQHIL